MKLLWWPIAESQTDANQCVYIAFNFWQLKMWPSASVPLTEILSNPLLALHLSLCPTSQGEYRWCWEEKSVQMDVLCPCELLAVAVSSEGWGCRRDSSASSALSMGSSRSLTRSVSGSSHCSLTFPAAFFFGLVTDFFIIIFLNLCSLSSFIREKDKKRSEQICQSERFYVLGFSSAW